MESPDREVREKAASSWCAWEDAVISLEPNTKIGFYSGGITDDKVGFVRICTHFLTDEALLKMDLLGNADRLAGIPGVLIHGRLDLSCPLKTAWLLAQAWPTAKLIALSDSGHQRSDSKRRALIDALDRFATIA